MNYEYQINNLSKKVDLKIEIKTECGEKVIFYVNINKEKKIESIQFENKGSQLISTCSNSICKTMINISLANFNKIKEKIWRNIKIKLIGSRKEIIKKIIKDTIDQMQKFA